MQGLGIQVLLGKQTQALLGNASVQALRFASGEELEAELVVIAAGIRPNAQLATDAGLDVRRGIVCRNLALISEPPEDLPGR